MFSRFTAGRHGSHERIDADSPGTCLESFARPCILRDPSTQAVYYFLVLTGFGCLSYRPLDACDVIQVEEVRDFHEHGEEPAQGAAGCPQRKAVAEDEAGPGCRPLGSR